MQGSSDVTTHESRIKFITDEALSTEVISERLEAQAAIWLVFIESDTERTVKNRKRALIGKKVCTRAECHD